jgi:uncharacterized Zn finger protein (UPF0148 family)
MRICPLCKKPFWKKREGTIFCGDICRNKHYQSQYKKNETESLKRLKEMVKRNGGIGI